MPSTPVFAPDGTVRDIPEDQVQAAIANGGKIAVRMKDPQGTLRYIPQDSVEDAKRAGGALADDPTHVETGVWAGIKRGVSNIASLPGQVYHAVADDPRDVSEQFTSDRGGRLAVAAKRLLLDPQLDQERKAQEYYSQANNDPDSQAAHMGNMHRIAAVVPVVGPIAGELTDRYLKGDKGGALAEGATYIAAPKVAEKVIKTIPKVADIPSPRGSMAERMQKPVEPGGPTRAEINDAARENNVNLDLAQATDHPVAKAVKKANRYSVASQGTYDSAAESNIDALSKWADKEASKYADNGNREVAGQRTVAALKDDLTRKQEAARTLYDGLDQRVGGVSQDVTGTIQSEAAKILSENKDYYAKHPELKPGKAWAIIEDLGSRSTKTAEAPVSTGGAEVLDSAGNPITKQVTQTVPKTASWSELHQLRSDLMEFYRNSPDIVKGRSEGWIQRMVGSIDESMTKAEGTMKPSDVADFRQANSIWKSIQETYNNPRSPYYQALKTAAPSQVPGMFASSPEFIRSLRSTISGLDGPVQRAFVEDNIINGKDGHIDLANMNSRLGRIPDAKLVEMVGAEGAKNLRIMGRVAAKVYADYKGSQTAERGVPMAEAVNLFANPVAGVSELGAQYAGAKAINSPRVVDYLTKQRAAGRVPPKTGGVAGSEPVAPVTPEPQPPTSGATEQRGTKNNPLTYMGSHEAKIGDYRNGNGGLEQLREVDPRDPRLIHEHQIGTNEDEFHADQSKVSEYAKLPPETASPIEVQSDNGKLVITDGMHRWEAAKKRGDQKIQAWVADSRNTTEYPDGTTHEAPVPETVGTKEGALTDTALFERARAKMPEGTPISAIAMEAQRMKVQEEAFVKQARKELGPKASMTSVMRRVQDLKDRKK